MSTENLTKRKIQAINTKKEILDVAAKLIGKYGYDKVSINQICREAGVSVGAFYHHFSSKEDIIAESYREFDDVLENYVKENMGIEGSVDKIIELIIFQMKYAEEKGLDNISQFYKAQIYAGSEFFISEERYLPTVLREIISKCQDNGEIRSDIPPRTMANHILRVSRGIIYDWCVHRGGFNLIEEARETVFYFLESFKACKAGTKFED